MSYEAWGDGDYDLGNCPDCDGTGIVCDEEDVDCLRCGGTGWIETERHNYGCVEMIEDNYETDSPPPCCKSCRVPYVEHLGLIGTCAELLKVRQENVALRSALGGLIGYASSVDVDNVPWVRGLVLRINRAMEAMGVEEGYVVIGGKIVKAGGGG